MSFSHYQALNWPILSTYFLSHLSISSARPRGGGKDLLSHTRSLFQKNTVVALGRG